MSKAGGRGEPRHDRGWSAAAAGIERWRLSQSWRRAVDAELRVLDLNLTRWLVLQVTSLGTASGDPVSQREVAERAGMTEMAVSNAMGNLVVRDWVDRATGDGSSAWRIYLTPSGERVLAEGRARIEAVSARWFAR